MRFVKKLVQGLLILIVVIMAMVSVMMLRDARIDYDVSTEGVSIPTYTAMDINYDQSNHFTESLPFAGSAIIDIDNDGTEELFLGGGPGQNDGLFRFDGDGFVAIADADGISKDARSVTYGASVIDVDGDGRDDLLVARSDGIFLHRNTPDGFTNEKLDLPLEDNTTAMSLGVADLNRDGHFDLFVAGYIKFDRVEGQNIFNKKDYGGSSELFLNNGDNTFTNITDAAGLRYAHNTFMGIFVDIDADGAEDLVVAHDTGQVRTWRNNGDGTFENRSNPSSDVYSYPMGIAVGDYNNNGRVDFAFSNVGSTPPDFAIRGDLTDEQTSNWKWMLFDNLGDFAFRDVAENAKIANYEFSWGMVFEDLNLDGRDDLVVSENYIGLPPYKAPFLRLPGRLFIQNSQGEFAAVGKQAGVVNKRFSIAPLFADFNNDGYPDLVHVNIAGRSQAFLSNGGDAGYVKVKLPNRVSSIAATVTVTLDDGNVLQRPFVSGEGLCSDPTHILTFGLGDRSAVSIAVTYIDGTQVELAGPLRNELVVF